MENFKKIGELEFDTTYHGGNYSTGVALLNKYIELLNNCFTKRQNNLAEISYYVYQVKKLFDNHKQICFGLVYTKKNQEYSFNSIMIGFGFDTTQVSRLIGIYEKFVDKEFAFFRLQNYIADFSKSKLFELLVVDDNQLKKDIANNVLRPDMSVKLIRDYVKNYKALEKQNKKLSEEPKEQEEVEKPIEEDIPLVYNPKQHYDFSYFEKQSKAQLLNIVWELQKEYERIVKLKNNKKQGER